MFNIKTLVAVAALAAAGTASANVLNTVGTTQGGEMSLTLWSEAAQASFIFDTGIMLNDFRTQAGAVGFQYTVDLSANTEYQAFLALVAGAGASDVRFAFFGGDNSGNGVTDRSLLTTIGTGGDATAVTNGNIVDSLNRINTNYLSAVNADPRLNVSLGGAEHGAATFVKGAGGNAYVGELLGEAFGGKFQTVFANKGDAVSIYDFTRSSTSSGGDAVESFLAGNPQITATYSGDSFVVAAIPEPSTYALMLSGLVIAGVVARRRAK